MAFRLKRKETVSDGVKRVLLERIDKAQAVLREPGDNLPEAIHQARKCCKQLRAIYRLIGPEVGKTYKRENHRFRDAARELAGARDAEIAVASYDAVLDQFSDRIESRRPYSYIRRNLTLRRKAIVENEGELQHKAQWFIDQLDEARKQVKKLSIPDKGFAAIEKGLKRIYWQSFSVMHEAFNQPSDEKLHEWRKYAKYHWFHIRFLQNLDPETFEDRSEGLYRLTETLGAHQDLCVLENVIEQDSEKFSANTDMEGFLNMLHMRKEGLANEAEVLGKDLFSSEPKKSTQSLKALWKVWRKTKTPDKIKKINKKSNKIKA